MERVTVKFGRKRVDARAGETILNVAAKAGIRLRSECGGAGICGKCRVTAHGFLSKPTRIEERMLSAEEIDRGCRLACQARVFGDANVRIPAEGRIKVLRERDFVAELDPMVSVRTLSIDRSQLFDEESLRRAGLIPTLDVLQQLPDVARKRSVKVIAWGNRAVDLGGRAFGAAIDLGTSTLSMEIVNLASGRSVRRVSEENPQMGEDILLRLGEAARSGESRIRMQRMLVESLNRMMGMHSSRVYESVVVGNTAMLHLLLAIPPQRLMFSPYIPSFKGPLDIEASKIHLANPRGNVHLLPVVGGFIGSDLVSSVVSCELWKHRRCMLIDIGTNTEIVACDGGKFVACSCASGPAFEGYGLKFGMRAREGAIEGVKLTERGAKLRVIGNAAPRGICGSGIIDVIAELLRAGIVDENGRMDERFFLTPEIYVDDEDIRQILLAKAAIYAGCVTLMNEMGWERIDELLIAGAFGNSLNVDNARLIGLIPDAGRVRLVGNSALRGAKICLLSRRMRLVAGEVADRIRMVNLASNDVFRNEFLGALRLRRVE